MPHGAGLDVAQIVGASLAIADEEGVDRLTMRRLSQELGVTPMAIYRHVANKDELLALVLDDSMRIVRHVDPAGDVTVELVRWGMDFHRLLVGHPSLAREMATTRLEGEAALTAAAAILECAATAGIPPDRADELLVTLFSFVLGSALYRVSRSDAARRFGGRSLPEAVGGSATAAVRQRLAGIELSDGQLRDAIRLVVNGYR